MAGAVQIIRTIVRGDPGPLEATVNHSYAVLGPDGATVKTLPWDDALWQAIRETREERPDLAKLERLGQHLYPLLGDVYEQAMNSDATTAVRIGLRLDSSGPAEELFSLPFELLRSSDTGRRLGATDQVLVCYQDVKLPRLRPDPQPDRPVGRLLFGWYGSDLQEVRDQQIRTIQQAFLDGGAQFIQAEDIFELSFQNLKAKLQENPNERGPACALHILCHTGPLGASEPGYGMVWADGIHPGARVAELLAEHADRLRLVVISSCLGSASAPNGPFRSVALELHKAGVEGVIGARSPITPESSVLLTRELYRSLLCGPSSLEQAFLTARRAIQSAWPGGLDHLGLQLFTHDFERWDTRPFTHRPYRGLERFRERDARFFFGRDREIAETVADVEALVATGRPRLLIVAGGSGTGKSSLVLAGVLPELRRRGWTVAEVLRPSELDAERWMDQVASCTRAPRGEAGLVLVVDQFEEIFTTLDEATRCALTRHLWSVAGDPSSGVAVITTLRVDFIGRCGEIVIDQDRRLDHVAYDEAHRVFIERIGPAGLRRAIEEPARMVGLVLEDGLAARVAEDVEAEAGALPLVQHAMDRLWHERKSRALIWPVGGVRGALEQHANAVYEALSEPERAAARRILLELVLVKGDRGAPVTKLRLTRDRVLGSRPEEEEPRVLDRLIDERLLVSEGSKDAEGGAWIEIAHEALITHWETFAGWLETARDMKAATGQIQGWADDPERFPFLNPQQLGHAHVVDSKYPGELSEQARELMRKSDDKARGDRWRLVLAALAVTGALVALVVAALIASKRAEEEATRAWDRSLMLAAAQAGDQPLLKAVLLREVARPREVDGWMERAAALSWTPLPEKVLGGFDAGMTLARFTPDGTGVLTQGRDGWMLWPVEGQGPGVKLEGALQDTVRIAFSGDGTSLIMSNALSRMAQLWTRSSGTSYAMVWQREHVASPRFSPDGLRVLAPMVDGTVQVLGTTQATMIAKIESGATRVEEAKFAGTSARVATWHADGRLRLWSLDRPSLPMLICEFNPGKVQVSQSTESDIVGGTSQSAETAGMIDEEPTFSPRGGLLIAHISAISGEWRIWDLLSEDCEKPAVSFSDNDKPSFKPTESRNDDPVFSSDDRSLVFISRQGDPWVWTKGGKLRPVFDAPDEAWRSGRLEVASDSMALLTELREGILLRWEFDGSSQPHILGFADRDLWSGSALATIPDLLMRAEQFAGAGQPSGWSGDALRGIDRLWRGTNPIEIIMNGARLATTSGDGVAAVWLRGAGSLPKPLADLGDVVSNSLNASYSMNQKSIVSIRADCKRVVNGPDRILGPCRELHYALSVGRGGGPDVGVLLNGEGEFTPLFGEDGAFYRVAADRDVLQIAAPGWWSDLKEIPKKLVDMDSIEGEHIFSMMGGRFLSIQDGILGIAPISEPERVLHLGPCPEVRFAVISANGRRVAARCTEDTIQTWEIESDGAVHPPIELGMGEQLWGATLSGTGEWLVLNDGSQAWVVRADGSRAPSLLEHAADVEFAPNSRYAIGIPSANLDESSLLALWNLEGTVEAQKIPVRAGDVREVAFSQDSTGIRVLLKDATVREFSVADPTAPPTIYAGPPTSRGDVQELGPMFSADLNHILTTSSAGFVREWPVRDHEQVLEALWRATPYCLPPEERRVRLQENDEESNARFEACQARVKACQDPSVKECSTAGPRYRAPRWYDSWMTFNR